MGFLTVLVNEVQFFWGERPFCARMSEVVAVLIEVSTETCFCFSDTVCSDCDEREYRYLGWAINFALDSVTDYLKIIVAKGFSCVRNYAFLDLCNKITVVN